MERIDTSHSIWLFDTERMRFRRMPRGADPAAPSFEGDWEAYYALEIDDDGSFTVALNPERTRLLRSYRDDADTGAAADLVTPPPPADATNELRLETAEGLAEP
jgi:hypothetical protein